MSFVRPAYVPFPVPVFFFFNDTATTEIYTLSLHDALPILFVLTHHPREPVVKEGGTSYTFVTEGIEAALEQRSEEHTSELQSPCNLVCRLLLEKKKNRRPVEGPRVRADTEDHSACLVCCAD